MLAGLLVESRGLPLGPGARHPVDELLIVHGMDGRVAVVGDVVNLGTGRRERGT